MLLKKLVQITCFLFMFGLLAANYIQAEPNYAKQAQQLLQEAPLIDGHNDLPWQLRYQYDNKFSQLNLNNTSQWQTPLHTDWQRMQKGGVGAQFWSIYTRQTHDGSYAKDYLEQIDTVYRLIQQYPDQLALATSADDIERIHKQGKLASLLGIEGGYAIDNSLALLRMYYKLGVRYMTLTHNRNLSWADSATDIPENNGLTQFGIDVVKEMNRLGMLIDLSHTSKATMLDAIKTSTAPVIFSHSSVAALNPHPRNVPSSLLTALNQNQGIVMVSFVPQFTSSAFRQWLANKHAEHERLLTLHPSQPKRVEQLLENWVKAQPKPQVSVSEVADHIDYLRNKIGIDYIGLGSDFDGVPYTIEGLDDVSSYPKLLEELLSRGYSSKDVKKIMGLNLLRVMRAVEAVAARFNQTDPV